MLFPFIREKATASATPRLTPKPLEISALVTNYAWQSIRNPKDGVRCYIAIQVLKRLQESNAKCVQYSRCQVITHFNTETQRGQTPLQKAESFLVLVLKDKKRDVFALLEPG